MTDSFAWSDAFSGQIPLECRKIKRFLPQAMKQKQNNSLGAAKITFIMLAPGAKTG